MQTIREHAVVVGASMGGLLAARVLAEAKASSKNQRGGKQDVLSGRLRSGPNHPQQGQGMA